MLDACQLLLPSHTRIFSAVPAATEVATLTQERRRRAKRYVRRVFPPLPCASRNYREPFRAASMLEVRLL